MQHLLPHLCKRSYVDELLCCFFPKLEQIASVLEIPDNCINLQYIPNPDTFTRDDHYTKESYIFLREKLLPFIQAYKPAEVYDKIYISRSRATKRKIINSADFEKYLQMQGFHILYLEDLGAIEQMAYFYNASVIISPHGAALTNIIFCKEGTQVIEIASEKMSSMKHFSHIAESLNLNYSINTRVITYSDSVDSNMIICF